MSLKQEIETWVTALQHYDNNEFEEAVGSFENIAETSRILFNLGVIHATLGQHPQAVEYYRKAIKLDQYLAIAYFQEGVSNFLMEDFEEALVNFNDTLLYLRGNTMIDYEQLGLKHKLFSCEVLFNRGMCYMYLGQKEAGMQDFTYAVKEKQNELHNVIDDAIKEEAEGYTVFSIPVGVVYRPNEAKVKNLKTKDYLGKARLVAALDRQNAYTGFTGAEKKKLAEGAQGVDDRPLENVSYAATNLVRPGLSSRTRQQSEPPANRQMFPPTPPPEAEKPQSSSSSSAASTAAGMLMNRNISVRSDGAIAPPRASGSKPAPLNLSRSDSAPEKPRLGTVRTASEPRPQGKYNPARPPGLSASRSKGNGPTPLRIRAGDPMILDEREEDEAMAEDLYDMYRPSRTNSSTSSRNPLRQPSGRSATSSRRNEYIPEDIRSNSDRMDEDSYSDQEQFEMMAPKPRSRASRPPSQQSRAQSPPFEMSKIRVKAHFRSVTKYIMIHGSDLTLRDLEDKVKFKFMLQKGRFNISVKDEDGGEMVELGDEDDMHAIVESALSISMRDRCDMGKVEIWVDGM